MARKPIEFTITAVDKATATMNKVNQSIARMTEPYQRLGRSMKDFSKASGLDKVGEQIGDLGGRARKAAGDIAKIGAPLLALIGGGTLAGLTDMVVQFERLGAETERTSRLMGVTAQQLTQLRGAAELAGVSADTASAGFQAFGSTLEDAVAGRNQAAYGTLLTLGVHLKTLHGNTIDAESALKDMADIIQRVQKTNPYAARNLARSLGLESMLPLLVEGRKGIEEYEKRANRLRGAFTPAMADRARKFGQAMTDMKLATDGLKTSIADKLTPVLMPLIERITDWIVKNRNLIATRVAYYVDEFAQALQKVPWEQVASALVDIASGAASFAGWVVRVVDWLGGWRHAAFLVGTYMVGGFALSVMSTIGSIVMLIARIALLIRAWRGVEAAAGAASLAQKAAQLMGLGGAGGVLARGAGVAGRFLARGAGFAGRFLNPATLAALLMSYSPNLNMGEDAQLKRIRAAEKAAGGKWPGSPLAGGPNAAKDDANPADGGADSASMLAAGSFADAVINAGEEFAQRVRDSFVGGGGGMGGYGGYGGYGGVTQSVRTWAQQLGFAGLEKRYNLPAGLLAGLAQTESAGNAGAVSRAGAQGLFQFMPGTARQYGINPLDPAQSADAAGRMMRDLLKHYNGNLVSALAAYNWGAGNLDRKGLANAPAETRNYAPSVLAHMNAFNSGEDMPSMLGGGAAQAPMPAGAPVVNVDNHVHVARDGSVTVRTQTPSGLKIARPVAPMV